MKFIITRLIAGLLLLSISITTKSQDSLFAPVSVYRCGIHYIIVFHYKPIPDSIKTRIVRLKFPKSGGGDSIAHDTDVIKYFSANAILYQEVPAGTEQLTDPTPVKFGAEIRGKDVNFLKGVFDILCNQPKKQFTSPPVQTPATVPGHSAHWKPATKRSDNSFWMIGSENAGGPGDTIVLSGKYSYAYVSKSYSSDIVIYTTGGQVSFNSGFSIENTNHVKVDGSGGDSLYGIYIKGGGTNFTITGKSNYIDIGYIDMRNGGVGGIFDKTEVSDVQNKYDCDPSYLYPTRAMNHRLHDLRLRNIQGDGIYEGSTGSTGGRPLTCSGTTTYPKPMGVGFTELDHITLDSINRQGGQISGADTGWVKLHDCIVTNTGYEYNTSQGAGLAIGSATKDADVYGNQIHHTFLYNFYSYGDGLTQFHENVTDTAGQVGVKGTPGWKANSQQLPATLFSPQNKPSTLKIRDNKTGYNTAVNQGKPVGYVIYGNTKILTNTGNVFCNNVGNLQNTTGVAFDSSCATNTFTITATPDANTVITPPGITSVTQGGSQAYTITANKGFTVADVKVDNVSIGAASSYVFSNVKANHTISSTAAAKTYTITASSIGGGTISPPGSTQVQWGKSITYTIAPSAGYYTKTLKVDDSIIDPNLTSYTFKNVKADHTISATFALSSFTISAASSAGGSITPSGDISVKAGESQTFTFTANAGYEVGDVIVDGSGIGAVTSYTFYNVTADHTIRVNFRTASGGNLPPVAVAALRSRVSETSYAAALTADSSYDLDGNIVSYQWEQLSGGSITIANPDAVTTQITDFTSGSYKFKLTVTDNSGATDSTIIIVVINEASATVSKKFGIKFGSQ
jgi:hypothetical protein